MSRRKAIGTATIITLAAVLMVIVGATSLIVLSSTSSNWSTSTGGQPSTFYSTVSPQGLQLRVRLNTTTIRAAGALTAQVSLFNTLAKNVSVVPDYSAMKNLSKWDWNLNLCGFSPVFDAFSFALFQGHYTSANISQAAGPLRLAPPTLSTCPLAGELPNVKNIEFGRESSLSTISRNPPRESSTLTVEMQYNATTGYCRTRSGTVTEIITNNGTETTSTLLEPGSECGYSTSLYGYWTWPNANDTCFDCNLHPFPIGSYTLVAEDEWNQAVFAYFQVKSG